MAASAAQRTSRPDSRRPLVLKAAAALFAAQGYHGTSMRDIAKAAGMLPGSLYCHFPSKSQLLLAVYGEGVTRIIERVDGALDEADAAWERLEAACVAHLETLLDQSASARVVIRVLPGDAPEVESELVALRDRYETRLCGLIGALELPPEVAATMFRLLLIGALNWAQTWYRPGDATPREIARQFLACLRPLVAERKTA